MNTIPKLIEGSANVPANARNHSHDYLAKKVWPLIAKGQLKPLRYKSFDLTEARQAHEFLDQGQHVGKLVLIVKYDLL